VGSQYLGEIQAFAFPFASGGFNQSWLPCAGQLLSIQQYPALFSLIGTSYGGNGTTNFQLPNMVGTISNSQGTGPGLEPRILGETLGAASVTLTTQTMAAHTHGLQLGNATAAGAAPGPGTASNMAAINPANNGFVPPPSSVTFSQNAMSMTGSGQGHPNIQPTQAIVWCIATQGNFPSFSSS
jgi:microcystin-dependent protein